MTYSPRYQPLALTLTLTVVLATALRSPLHVHLLGIAFLVALLVSIWFVTRNGYHLAILTLLGLSSLALNTLLPARVPGSVLSALDNGLEVAFTGYIGAMIMRHLARTPRITKQELLGVYSVYLLAGILFSQAYDLLFYFDPGSIRFDPARFGDARPGTPELLYYSFMTLGTVGFGDATPGTSVARAVTVVESIFGVIFLATVMGRYVALHIEHSREEGPAGRR